MRKINDMKEESNGDPPSKTVLFWIVGALSIGVFLGLLWFFKKSEPPTPPLDFEALSPPPQTTPDTFGLPPPEQGPAGLPIPDSQPPPPLPREPVPARLDPEETSVVKGLREQKRERPRETERSVSAGKPPRKSSPKKSPTTGSHAGVYTIQVASFSQSVRAEALAGTLKKKGLDAYVAASDVPSKGTMHRVRIGHFKSRAEAHKRAQQIQQAEGLSFFITTTAP